MISDELAYHIRRHFAFEPTEEQERAIRQLCRFLTDRHDRVAMILRGCAGTGKTTLAGAVVRALTELGQKMVLLAPTGRAAKVFSLNAGHPAFTIHRKIYRQKTLNAEMSGFTLSDNLHADTLFIIDEASMIANTGMTDSAFGSGCLLDDLVQYVYSGRNCRMVLIGDAAQLPPVGETESPALSRLMMEGYGLGIYEADLREVLRQTSESGILYNATRIRSEEQEGESEQCNGMALPKIQLKGFTDIQVVPGNELIDALGTSYYKVGKDDTMVITRSNKRANIYNQGIRNMVLDRDEELSTGDMLMIVKNNYYWTEQEGKALAANKASGNAANDSTGKADEEEMKAIPAFIANGDRARVMRVRNTRELYGFRFADITLCFPDYDNYELTATVLLDTLTTEAPALTREQHERLFNAIMEDYADIPRKADRIKQLKKDIYYNALQVKFAYAVTCHKAQGGQWAHIYIDQGYMTDDMVTPDYIHWLYTAFTRATEKLFLVNWPESQTM